jgi:ATP-dependent helicase/nuclease subunit B
VRARTISPVTVDVRWVRYGRGAAERLRDALAEAKGGDPLAPATVVVPSNHVGVAIRRLLASGEAGPLSPVGSGIAAVTFLTVYRLAELLGAARLAATGRRPVSTPVIAAAVRGVLEEDPGIFRPVADHPATEVALVASYQELRELSPQLLDRVAAQSRRAADVVRVQRSVRERLERDFSDEEDLTEAAIAVVRDRRREWRLGPVIVYLPLRLSRHGADLLGAVAERTRVLVLAGATGDARADAEVRRAAASLDPRAAATYPAATVDAPLFGVASGTTRVVTTSDADEEVRAAVRAVVDAARDGTPLERIALLYGARDPYARIVHEQLDLAGIAHNGTAVVPLTARVAGRTLLGLLTLPASAFRREDVFAWLSGARVRHQGRNVPVAAWERLSREAGIVAGRDQWDRLLTTYADDLLAEADRRAADPEIAPWQLRRLQEGANRVIGLRQFVLELIDDLAEAARPRSWRAHAEWARTLLRTMLGSDVSRSGWPLAERKALERTTRALDRLAGLSAIEGPVGLDVFQRTLELELEADLGRVGRMGEGVLVGSVRMGVGLDLDLAIFLGVAEGSLPSVVREDSLLPDDERAAAGDELPLRRDETERQHHDLLAAMSGATRHVLCLPRGDLRRSNERVPSRWLDDIAGELAGRPVTGEALLRLRAPWLDHVASYDAGLRAATPATEQEYRLRALLAHPPAGAGVDDAVLTAGTEVATARRGPAFTRFDGNLAGLCVPTPAGNVTSATRLEAWAVCPFAYFAKEVLRVEPVENPEDRLRISPLDLGSLVHEVLERFVADVLARPEPTRPGPDDPWTDADRCRLVTIANSVCDRYEAHGLVGRLIFWRGERRRTIADLERFLSRDSAHRAANRTRPLAAELAFGMSAEGSGGVELSVPDGRTVSFRGKADRLDETEDGGLEVVDYKTGRADQYTGLSEAEPTAGGRRLQLGVYALAARAFVARPDAPVRSDYWFVSTKGGFKRIGYPVDPDVLQRVATTVGQMVAGIEAGVFPSYPTAASSTPYVDCHYCDPDGLGVADLRRRLEKMRGDPALEVFLSLAEGASAGRTADEEQDEGAEADEVDADSSAGGATNGGATRR